MKKVQRNLRKLVILVTIFSSIISCKKEKDEMELAITGINFKKMTVSITEGETYQSKAIITPVEASDKTLIWSSNKPTIASVNSKGLVKAIKVGTVVITAKSDKDKLNATYTLNIEKIHIPVTDIKFQNLKISIIQGETYQSKATITPVEASDKTLIWSSDKSNIASVDPNGLVTANEVGTVIITAKSEKDEVTATYTLEIKENIIVFGDAKFKKVLLDAKVDSNKDQEISEKEALQVTELDMRNSGISTISEIHYFSNLKYLSCDKNQLTQVDLSRNTKLTDLILSNNKGLTGLDITNNTELKYLSVRNTSISNLDLRKSIKLITLDVTRCNLSSLDIINNTELKYVSVSKTPISDLDLKKNIKLIDLNVARCNLSSLDVSYCPNLENLYCNEQSISELDLKKNIKLTKLDVAMCKLSSLDVSYCPNLEELVCNEQSISELDLRKNIKLTKLDVRGGNLSSLDVSFCLNLKSLYCNRQALLKEIYVFDKSYAETKSFYKDAGASWIEKKN